MGEALQYVTDRRMHMGERRMNEQDTCREECRLRGKVIVEKGKALLREGNARRVVVKNAAGRTLVDLPLTLSAVIVVIQPRLAALGALAAVAMRGTISVEKDEQEEPASADAVHPTSEEAVG
jgi:hypothetical protein